MNKIMIWDNHGTITGFMDLTDQSHYQCILPNVEKIMRAKGTCNIICSGTSVKTNYDPEKIIAKFKKLMIELPICAAIFCPDAAGMQCWVLRKEDDTFSITKAHEDERYMLFAGQFKKPANSMLTVISDILSEYGLCMNEHNTTFVGDSWQDLQAAHRANIPFLHAGNIHRMQEHEIDYGPHIIDPCHGQELIDAWKQFFATHNWQELIQKVAPAPSQCGIVYDLPNYLNRPNESIAVVDMRTTLYAQPHYHPDLEVYIILEGTAIIAVGSNKYHAKQGDIISVWPFSGHYIIPDQNFVLACVNVPPYTQASHIPLYASDDFLDFDYDDFLATVYTQQTEKNSHALQTTL